MSVLGNKSIRLYLRHGLNYLQSSSLTFSRTYWWNKLYLRKVPFDLSIDWDVLFIGSHKLHDPGLSSNMFLKRDHFIWFYSARGTNLHFSSLIFTVGWRRIQHWEGSPCSDTEAENHGVLWKEGETNWAAKENVSCLVEVVGFRAWAFPLLLIFYKTLVSGQIAA